MLWQLRGNRSALESLKQRLLHPVSQPADPTVRILAFASYGREGQERMAAKRTTKVSRQSAEEAVRTLLRWAGEDPAREGLLDTPKRVVKAYEDWFSGYKSDPADYLRRTFEEVGGYDEMVVLRDISASRFVSITWR